MIFKKSIKCTKINENVLLPHIKVYFHKHISIFFSKLATIYPNRMIGV